MNRGIYFFETKGKKLLPAGSSSEAATPTSRSPEIWIARRVLEEAGGVRSSASGLSATGITCRKVRKEKTRKRMKRSSFCHTCQGLRDFSSLPLQQLWMLSFLLALTRVRGTLIQLHTSFQRGWTASR